MNYIVQHWQGNHSLGRSFWINLVGLTIAINFVERFTLPPYLTQEPAVSAAVGAHILLSRILIYGWQVVGTLRACDTALKQGTDRYWITAVHGSIVLSFVFTLIMGFSSVQRWQGYRQSLVPIQAELFAPNYTYSLAGDAGLLRIEGPLEAGITAKISSFLEEHPDVSGIILDSDGGQIAEGRGIARLVMERQLDTYSIRHCMSACTIAFAAGKSRHIGTNTRIGFHQYQSFTTYPRFDIAEEQARELAFFRKQGIAEEFLQKIYSRPPTQMWWPDQAELIKGGFVHRIGLPPGVSSKTGKSEGRSEGS